MTAAGPLVGDVGEAELLRRLQPYLDNHAPGLPVGVGDDAAIWEPGDGYAVVATTDTLVEDVHFHAWPGDQAFYADLGWKLLAVSLSDLAAMGARPGPALLALALPPRWPAADVEALYRGLSECARAHGASLAGGNLSGAAVAVLTSTCLGAVDPALALLREGGVQGWQIAVTGRLGGAAAALHLLHDPDSVQAKSVSAASAAAWTLRLRRPQPRLAAAAALVEAGVRVCLDVSDGVYVDAGRILRDGVGAVIDTRLMPVEAGVREAFPHSWLELAGGGEDYELLFAGPPATVADACSRIVAGGLDATVIGALDDGADLRLRGPGGELVDVPRTGHEHFRA